MSSFFVQKHFVQLLFAYSLVLLFLSEKKLAQKQVIKRWCNWPQVALAAGVRHDDLHDVLELVHVEDPVPVLVEERVNEINLFLRHLLADHPHQQVGELGLGQGPLLVVEPEQLDRVDVLEEVLEDGIVPGLAGVGNFWESSKEKEYDDDAAKKEESGDDKKGVRILLEAGVLKQKEE